MSGRSFQICSVLHLASVAGMGPHQVSFTVDMSRPLYSGFERLHFYTLGPNNLTCRLYSVLLSNI